MQHALTIRKLPLVVEPVDILGEARSSPESIQEDAREGPARYLYTAAILLVR